MWQTSFTLNKGQGLWIPAFAGTTRGEDSLKLRRRRHRRRRDHPLLPGWGCCVGVVQRVADWFPAGELCCDRADKTIAGAGGVDGRDGTARNDRGLVVD